MIVINAAELAQYRTALSADPIAQKALDFIEDCEGDLEDAAITIGLRVGQEPTESENWLDGLAKRWRVILCDALLHEALQTGAIAEAVKLLASETTLPAPLATPVVLYVLKTGLDDFCQPLQEKL